MQIGADIIELGVPYSDPLADGPTIQAAATRALQQGTTLDKASAAGARRGRLSAGWGGWPTHGTCLGDAARHRVRGPKHRLL